MRIRGYRIVNYTMVNDKNGYEIPWELINNITEDNDEGENYLSLIKEYIEDPSEYIYKNIEIIMNIILVILELKNVLLIFIQQI